MAHSDNALWNRTVAHVQKDPVVARAFMELFAQEPALVRQRAGAFVTAKVTVQRERIRYAKAYRLGQRLASVVSWIGRRSASTLRLGAIGAQAVGALAMPNLVRAEAPQHLMEPVVSHSDSELAFPEIDWTALDPVAEASPGMTA